MFLRVIKLDMLEIFSRKNKDAIKLKKKNTIDATAFVLVKN